MKIIWVDHHFKLTSVLNRLTVCAWVSNYSPSLSTFVLFQTFYGATGFYSVPSRVINLVCLNSGIRLIFDHLFMLSSINLTLFIRENSFFGRPNAISVNGRTTQPCILLIIVSFRPPLKFITLPHSLNFSCNWPLRRSSLLNIQLTIIYVNCVFTTHVSFIPLYILNWVLLCSIKATNRVISG